MTDHRLPMPATAEPNPTDTRSEVPRCRHRGLRETPVSRSATGPPVRSRGGIALFLVLGILAVMVPVMFFLYRLSSGSATAAQHYHERVTVEALAWSAGEAAISRLQDGQGIGSFSGTLGDGSYQFALYPKGAGVLGQKIFQVVGKGMLGRQQCTVMMECEQFPPDGGAGGPRLVIVRDTWFTVEPYDLNNAANVLAMENARGSELLYYTGRTPDDPIEGAWTYEAKTDEGAYRAMLGGKRGGLPPRVAATWDQIIGPLVDEKAGGGLATP